MSERTKKVIGVSVCVVASAGIVHEMIKRGKQMRDRRREASEDN